MEESIKVIKTFCEKYNYNSCYIGPEEWIKNNNIPKTIQYSTNNEMNNFIALRFEGNDEYILETFSIIEKINTLRNLIKNIELAECCVCYEKCNKEKQKCIKCDSSTCCTCRANIKKELYMDFITNLLSSDINKSKMAKIVQKLPFDCPVCRTQN